MALRETSITGRTQITRLLNHLQDLQSPLILSHDQTDCCRATLLAINPDEDYLLMEGIPLPQNHRLLQPNQQVDLRAQFHGEEAHFVSRIIEAADLAGKALLRTTLPDTIGYAQRRAHFRVPAEFVTPINVTLIHEDRGSLFGTLEDISLGGLAARMRVPSQEDQPRVQLCLIQLPGGDLFHSELEFSSIRPTGAEEIRVGGRFVELSEIQKRKLERFIRRLERELLKKKTD